MSKKRKRTAAELGAIRRYYAKKKKAGGQSSPGKKSRVGNVYFGCTKYIDPETKHKRRYVVVSDNQKTISIAKLKSIKKFDVEGRNVDRALVEINSGRYGLTRRTGVDFQVFHRNRMTKQPLCLEDRDVFPNGEAEFQLGSHDLHRTLKHTKRKK